LSNQTFQVVEGRYGRILLPLADKYIARSFLEYGEFSQGEADLFDFLLQPGMVVADLGANFGAHTLVFAKKARLVYAVEPQRMIYNALCGTLALNMLFNVIPIHGAVGIEDGSIPCGDFDLSDPRSNAGALSLPELPKEYQTYSVPLVRFTVKCNFMKIDVEGMEEDVLRGSADMIRECRPFLYVENDRKDKSASLIACVEDLGYRCHWHLVPLFNEKNSKGNPVNVFGEIYSLNMLCVPKEVEFVGLPLVTEPLHSTYTYTH
jgi:FkbM family methyltransferase